jgi:uncharacterized protein (TIGR02594 family)
MAARPILRRGSTDVEQVKQLQRMLNRVLIPSPQLGVLGNFKERTEAAVKAFQVASGLYPDGVVGPKTWAALGRSPVLAPGTSIVPPPTPPPTGNPSTDAPWVEIARGELKLKGNLPNVEKQGPDQNNPRILEYIATYPYLKTETATDGKVPKLGLDGKPVLDAKGKPEMIAKVVTNKDGKVMMMGEVDETPWCACFVNWCLKRAGKNTKGTDARAKSWATYGTELTEPRFGAVAVVRRAGKQSDATTHTGNHVAFYISGSAKLGQPGDIVLLGGNQVNGTRVSETPSKNYWIVKAYRWPV